MSQWETIDVARVQVRNDIAIVLALHPHVLSIVRKNIAGNAILDRIREVDAGDRIVAQEVIRNRVIARRVIVRRRRQEEKLFWVIGRPVKVDALAGINDLIIGESAVMAIDGDDPMIAHIADDVAADLGG